MTLDPKAALTQLIEEGGVRSFSNGKLQADIDAAIARAERAAAAAKEAPPVNMVVVQADLQGAKVVVARNKGPWTIAAIAEYDWKDRSFSAGAEVIWRL